VAVTAIAITGAAGTRVAVGKRRELVAKTGGTEAAAIATGIAANAAGRAAMARATEAASGIAGAIAIEM
jgi:hypothetical protein